MLEDDSAGYFVFLDDFPNETHVIEEEMQKPDQEYFVCVF